MSRVFPSGSSFASGSVTKFCTYWLVQHSNIYIIKYSKNYTCCGKLVCYGEQSYLDYVLTQCIVYFERQSSQSMMYSEALLHPEVKPLDEGFCSLLLTLAQCPSIQQSALVTKLSEALFTRRCKLTDAQGYIYSISLRQSKSIRKSFHLMLLFH